MEEEGTEKKGIGTDPTVEIVTSKSNWPHFCVAVKLHLIFALLLS